MEKIVIIPTFNEKDNIASIIQAVFSLNQGYHILVIDDGSPDGTAEIVKQLIQSYPNYLFLEERKGKLGLGTAYIHGFKWCLNRSYQYIFEMDADFSHDPKDLERLYFSCKNDGAQVAVGSRYVKGGQTENWPLDRQLYSRGGALYTKMLTWMPVQDPTAGFVCYKREVLEAINFDMISFVGYAFQIEMKFAAWKLGFIIKEVPIIFKDRKIGVSKMNKGIIKEGVLGVISIQWQSMFKNYRKRVKAT
ncbi:polyprenol monophosphomannose synthase [Sediminibacterium sp.]|uniref:polyprenol monophosphomannose synthase n=1 Tax=Sediminibacterium sp. TaxID=1917865 RepID=UPI00273754E2|nr:polyprenol monophosphomannose synthase [Sediminibacterium sp.]MDP3393616.1 polyprenol monophosphomannose synthase [Sediminibacterium sp.]MDP3566612.1 polyprenol monophosphomannose synthase [Sediminibacterium sp.]